MTAQNRISSIPPALAADVTAFIRSPPAGDEDFSRLALALFAFQHAHNPAYRRICDAQRRSPANVKYWREIPAVPTAAFKELELTVLPATERTAVFHSSGTTEQRPSRHFHSRESLAVYEASLLAWFEPHLRLAGSGPLRLVFLTPPPALAPRSSLVHMFDTVRRAHPDQSASFLGELCGCDALVAEGERGAPAAATPSVWSLPADQLVPALESAEPIALFGTAFNFVHLLDHLAGMGRQFTLSPGSRLMETGGYKGRSRALPREELHAALTSALGVPRDRIITEYGMSELGSQAYDSIIPALSNLRSQITDSPRRFHFPPWARAQIISPETGREVRDGEAGLVRVFDLANIASVLAVQTEDLAIRRGDGFELIGRAPAAEARGCSLMAAS